ncbi:MAG: hypothetical protein U0P81_01720 [Holophagaceae bacterium]
MSLRIPVRPVSDRFPARPLAFPALLLLLAAGTGCFRATGLQRSVLSAEEIPAVGGDRPAGLKAAAGPGDFYLGNDFIELAVDGTPFGERDAIAGAASGGSIVDVGYIELDTSFRRVSMPSDSLERLTPVANLDPDLAFVFDRYLPASDGDLASITATGGLYDPKHKLAGAAWDASDRVQGLAVTHKIELARLERNHFTLTTTVTNTGGTALPVRNLGDALLQHGGGFRAVIPAQKDAAGAPLSTWGAQIPGSDFTQPLATAVQAPMVGLLASEPGAATVDGHASLGLLPVDADTLLVASDRQDALTQARPQFPERVVAGGLPAAGNLAPGQSLTYRRRLYAVYGTSTSSPVFPGQTTGLLNLMQVDRSTLRQQDNGLLVYKAFGTMSRSGTLQAEIRFERNIGSATSPVWQLERVDWLEPQDLVPPTILVVSSSTPYYSAYLPTGTYRIVARNRNEQAVFTNLTNVEVDSTSPHVATPLVVSKTQAFVIAEDLAPERPRLQALDGSLKDTLLTPHYFSVVGQDQGLSFFQPAKLTFAGLGGAADPDWRRGRTLGSIYDQNSRGLLGLSASVGAFRFKGGNQVFGASYLGGSPEPALLARGAYSVYTTRGPLSSLESTPLQVSPEKDFSTTLHTVVVFPRAVPQGWVPLDVPGPSQATTGGLLPAEKLASALAEDVQVVGLTEMDLHADAEALRSEFLTEFGSTPETEADRAAIAGKPYVFGARSSVLGSYGEVTALFVPKPAGTIRNGARASRGWTLADFLAQAEGGFNVVHRPRGPQGLFTLKAFNPAVPLGTGVNAWWTAKGPFSLGRAQGSFEALELLRGEGFDPANPTAWFNEFKQVRADWFALLNQQTPTAFTKALGLSSARFSLDTPVGHARTYLKTGSATLKQEDLGAVLTALKSGAAVASTGPLLDVSIGAAGPGSLVPGPASTVNLSIVLTAGDWVPVDEVRIVVNGQVVQTVNVAATFSRTDLRTWSGSLAVNLPSGKDAWIVVEAGVPLGTSGAYAPASPWSKIYRGIYPVAVTNPIFVDANGGGYVPPGL